MAIRSARTVVVDPKAVHEDRQAVGEIKPRHESDLSFRVAGKVLARLVDVGASVKKGDTLATLTRRIFGTAYVRRGRCLLCRGRARRSAGYRGAQGQAVAERLDAQANYDTALRNLRSAEAKLTSAKASRDLTRDQLHYTELKADSTV